MVTEWIGQAVRQESTLMCDYLMARHPKIVLRILVVIAEILVVEHVVFLLWRFDGRMSWCENEVVNGVSWLWMEARCVLGVFGVCCHDVLCVEWIHQPL